MSLEGTGRAAPVGAALGTAAAELVTALEWAKTEAQVCAAVT